jgi:hypothetical protein
MLTAQQIVSKVKTPDHIQASTRNADRGNRVMVHGNDSKGSTIKASPVSPTELHHVT